MEISLQNEVNVPIPVHTIVPVPTVGERLFDTEFFDTELEIVVEQATSGEIENPQNHTSVLPNGNFEPENGAENTTCHLCKKRSRVNEVGQLIWYHADET